MIHILSWDAQRQQVVILDIPKDTVIEGTRGYGKYPLQSLLTLDTIDRHDGRVFVESLTDATGLPLLGYAEIPKSIQGGGSVHLVRSIFSWNSLFDARVRHGIPWKTWASWVVAARGLKADQVDVISAKNALVDEPQPDGSVVPLLDSSRLDYLYGSLFIDTPVRTENITVSVYNTTGVPTVGQRAARILTHMGISVVTVGNDESNLTRCLIRGNAKNLRSQTGKFMASYFRCTTEETKEEDGASDLSLQLGQEYASAFAR
jgi:hypothetical protein